jgi:glycosyltransferase involved in cell wall biosynthesis
MKALVLSNCAADPHTGSGSVIALVLDELDQIGARAHFFHLASRGIAGTARGARYLAPVRAWAQARRLLRLDDYDVVICFGAEWGLFTWWWSRRPRRWRLLQYSNGVESHAAAALRLAARQPGFPRPRWFQRGNLSGVHDLAFRHADHVAVVSEFDARYLRDVVGLAPDRVTTLPTPLPEYFLQAAGTEGVRPRVVGYCGGWIPIKNVSLIAQDVQAFLRAFPGWRFEAVGPGTERLAHAGTFERDVMPRVRGVGTMPREQLPGWYHQCAITLLPSVYDSFGLVAAEAMVCGCAVVASVNSGFPTSLVHGQEVYLLRSGQSPALEQALVELAESDELRASIARGGQRRALALSRASWRTSFRAMVSRLISTAPGTRRR